MKKEIKKGVEKTSKVFLLRTTGYILAGFGLVAALAWNDAIQTFVKAVFPRQGDTIVAKFIYALIITIVLVFISLRLDKKEDE